MQPAMFELGLGHLLEDGYAAAGWLLVGVIQIVALVAVVGPLQRWRSGHIPEDLCVPAAVLFVFVAEMNTAAVASPLMFESFSYGREQAK